jgi:hypothetical protein
MSDKGDDDESASNKRLKQKLRKLLKDKGITEFESQSRSTAVQFLYTSFYLASKHHFLIKQFPFLIEPDTMSEEDWLDYIDFNWRWFGIVAVDEEEYLN